MNKEINTPLPQSIVSPAISRLYCRWFTVAVVKLQNIHPFTKSQGLHKCFVSFITYLHRQRDLQLFLCEPTDHMGALSPPAPYWCQDAIRRICQGL